MIRPTAGVVLSESKGRNEFHHLLDASSHRLTPTKWCGWSEVGTCRRAKNEVGRRARWSVRIFGSSSLYRIYVYFRAETSPSLSWLASSQNFQRTSRSFLDCSPDRKPLSDSPWSYSVLGNLCTTIDFFLLGRFTPPTQHRSIWCMHCLINISV